MSSLRWNVVANFAGVGSAAAVQLLCVPLWMRLMGVEAYALVGFSMTLQLTLQMIDFGVTPTMSRELARRKGQLGGEAELRSFVRTLEVGYVVLGIALGALVAAAAPSVAERWLNRGSLPLEAVVTSVRMMGALVVLQWPVSLYSGGLQGLERQVSLNALRLGVNVASGAGSIAVLALVSPAVTSFFAWQLVVALGQFVVAAVLLSRALPRSPSAPRFAPALVRPVLGVAAGMGALGFLGMLLTQMDKLVLSRALSLEAFGYYVAAATVANGLQLFIRPLYTALFPRFSALVAGGDEGSLRTLYHQGTQAMAVLVAPAMLVLAVFSREVLWAWTGSAAIAAAAGPLLWGLALGTGLNGLMHLPYALQLAHGWTRIGLVIASAQVSVMLPLLVLGAARAGAVAGAWTWLTLNALYVAVGVPWTHARLLRGDAGRWLREALGPALAALGVVVAARLLWPAEASRMAAGLGLLVTGLMATAAAFAAAPALRDQAGQVRAGSAP